MNIVLDVKFTEFTRHHDLPGFDKRSAERGYEGYLSEKFRALRDLNGVTLCIRVDIA